MPETDKVVALADLFGVTTDYLLRQQVEKQSAQPASADGARKHDWVEKLSCLARTKGYLSGWILVAWGVADLLGLLSTALNLNQYSLNILPDFLGYIGRNDPGFDCAGGVFLHLLATDPRGSGDQNRKGGRPEWLKAVSVVEGTVDCTTGDSGTASDGQSGQYDDSVDLGNGIRGGGVSVGYTVSPCVE